MDKKDKLIFNLTLSLYYMMGLLEGSGCKASYDFVLENIADAEDVIGCEVR